MLRRLLEMPAESGPERVVVLSRDEDKQHTQRHVFEDPRLEYVLGDVRDEATCERALKGVDCVMHAAALKQVPTGEVFPEEMFATNVGGTANLVRASESAGVGRFVLLSTDKAVHPVNAYGMSKALGEKIVLAAAGRAAKGGSGTNFNVIRYGNVMGSRGSVIPVFLRQIAEGRPITVTDGRMTRFLLKLAEATALVLHAADSGVQGCTYSRRSPACTVDALVAALEMHFGRRFPTRKVGIRPGEKIHETLLTADEEARAHDEASSHDSGSVTVIRPYFAYRMTSDEEVLGRFDDKFFVDQAAFTSESTRQLSPEETLQFLRQAELLG
jgi:UDP-glucose 4-epimerase